MGTILMYIVNSEAEIPQTKAPNTAYYIVGKEVRILDNSGNEIVFSLRQQNDMETRLSNCEKQVGKIVKYLNSFKEE